jgi:transcriptional regulator GlxA family with amidase domain
MNDPDHYSERIQRVVDYLAEHLDETLDLEILARVAQLFALSLSPRLPRAARGNR